MEVDLFTISKGSAHHRSSLGQDAFQLYEDFFNGTLFQGLLGDRYHHENLGVCSVKVAGRLQDFAFYRTVLQEHCETKHILF